MNVNIGHILSNYQCGFGKCVNPIILWGIALIEKWRSSNAKKNSFWSLLTDLIRPYYLPHEFFIAKLAPYEFIK